MNVTWINFSARGDVRGLLVPMEAAKDVPFAIQRVYALLHMQAGVVRGAHAHRTLRQVIVALGGSCRITLDDGRDSETVVDLNDPARGLLLEPMVWHEMTGFSSDCVLLVLAAEHYDEGDYIRDRLEFVKLAKETFR
jgi:dTDP-4-dehydrorhamnose 3,5-epimerase-like enzyme